MAGLLAACVVAACTSPETRRCHELMTSAQATVNGVDSKDLSSVEQSLGAVELALDACDKAGRTGERDELTRAKNQLSAQVDYLKRRATEPSQKKRTPEEIAELVKKGDPDCPRGQAYRTKDGKQEIRCTGPEIVDFGLGHAKAYFSALDYKLTESAHPKTLRAEHGAELYVFEFANGEDAPSCVKLYPPPGMSWQEFTARATGVQPARLHENGTVHTARGDLVLAVEDSDKATIVRIGACGT